MPPVHNLKGVPLNYRAAALARLAMQLDEAGKRQDLSEAPALVEETEAAAEALRQSVRRAAS